MSVPRGLRVLSDLPLALEADEILRFQGYRRGRDVVGVEVAALLQEALAEASRLLRGRASVRWWPVDAFRPDAMVLGGHPLAIPGLGDRWGAVQEVAVAICTIGDELERRVGELWEARELPLASMLDSVGSCAVETLARAVHEDICRQGADAGLAVTGPLSPGWSAWDVREQHVLFRLCAGETIGVTLNEASVMTPGKSMSLVIGAGRAARVEEHASPCARCGMRECAYRRAPARERHGIGSP